MERLGSGFNLVVALLLPGLVVSYALSLHLGALAQLIGGQAFSPGPQLAAIAALVFVALGAGVAVDAAAQLLVRPLIRFSGITEQFRDHTRLAEARLVRTDRNLRSICRSQRAYANLLFSLLVLALALQAAGSEPSATHLAIFGGMVLTVFLAARGALRRCDSRMVELDRDGVERL